MKKLFLIVTFIIVLLGNYPTYSFAENLNIDPQCSYILIDSKAGQVIAENNADVKLRPASTTKIMTAIVAVENCDLDKKMVVSKGAVNDIGPGGMNIGIMPGEDNFTLRILLNAMLIKSANETANIISENVFESREKFIAKMNEKAKELGALNTHFVNPCGKDDTEEEKNHLSTARDMALIAQYAMTKPLIREIVGKEYYKEMPATNKHKNWEPFRTTNKLLWPVNSYPFEINGAKKKYSVNGIKTGFTSVAGSNLVSSAVSEDGTELIAVVMHVTEGNVFTYTKDLFKYGFQSFSNQKVVDSGKVLKSIKLNGVKDNGNLDLVTASELVCAMPIDSSKWNIVHTEHIKPSISLPVTKGDVLGYMEYKKDGILLGKVDLVASRTIKKEEKAKLIGSIKEGAWIKALVIGAAAILALIIILLAFKIITVRTRSKKNGLYISRVSFSDKNIKGK